MDNISRHTRQLAVLGMMLALISALSFLEHLIPPLPGLPPNVRLGLSNIVTMYVLFFMGRRHAFALTALKSLFVLLMRGFTAGLLSLCGGMLAILVVAFLALVLRQRISYLLLSVFGAIFHNLGQIAAASLLLSTDLVTPFLPALLLFGVAMGAVTGTLLRVVMPLFHRSLGYWNSL